MPIYHFDVNECGVVTVDEDGRDCASVDEALAYAVSIARGIMAAEVLIGKLCLSCAIEIRDASRALVQKMPFSFAIDISGGAAD